MLLMIMNVLYSTCCCNPIPITVDIPVLESVHNDNSNHSVNWSKLSAADKVTYARDIDVHLNAVKVPYLTEVSSLVRG